MYDTLIPSLLNYLYHLIVLITYYDYVSKGHCYSSTVQDYYLLQDRVADYQKSAESFDKVSGGKKKTRQQQPKYDDDHEEEEDEVRYVVGSGGVEGKDERIHTNSCISIMQPSSNWGSSHPYGDKTNVSKVTWSRQETAYIGKVAAEIKSAQGSNPKRLCAQILKVLFCFFFRTNFCCLKGF